MGVSGLLFFPGWMGDYGDSTFTVLFSFENYSPCAAVGQEEKTRRWKPLGGASWPAAGRRDPRSGAGGVAGETGRRRGGDAQPFVAAGAWPCPGRGEASGQGLAGASGAQF